VRSRQIRVLFSFSLSTTARSTFFPWNKGLLLVAFRSSNRGPLSPFLSFCASISISPCVICNPGFLSRFWVFFFCLCDDPVLSFFFDRRPRRSTPLPTRARNGSVFQSPPSIRYSPLALATSTRLALHHDRPSLLSKTTFFSLFSFTGDRQGYLPVQFQSFKLPLSFGAIAWFDLTLSPDGSAKSFFPE